MVERLADMITLNFTINYTDQLHMDTWSQHSTSRSVLKRPAVAAFVTTVHVIVIILGGLGNGLVVVTVATTKRLQNATNIFITNLAVADIFVSVFDLPLNLYYQLTEDWVYGKALCHVIPAMFGVVVYASTLSLTMIAVDRFLLIVFPETRRMTVRHAVIVVALILIISSVGALPVAVFADYVSLEVHVQVKFRMCAEKWPSSTLRNIYTVATLLIQFIIPLAVIAVLYVLVLWKVRKSRKQLSLTHASKTKNKNDRRRKSKTTMMLVAVVLVFAVCWIPYQTFSVVCEFSRTLVSGPYFSFVDVMLRVFAMSSSCVNPILYGWLNDNFRNAFLDIVFTGRRAKRLAASTGVTAVPTCTTVPLTGTPENGKGGRGTCGARGRNELIVPRRAISGDDFSTGSSIGRSMADVHLTDRTYGTISPESGDRVRTGDASTEL